ncbi:A24 family peptidase [Lacicoccus alkaliphilus]|uniref:Prepilin peptidase CpaA n=1 Tax=Lacicoccus alkaliphilus DSM 16010 TaxID=1123231 RepID=A0A1M7GP25_9BACL|nr:prepilin peptidase [Salinicoccus alkaliphilus]SHM18073.1 prepilin peptidase CpaA [Salinicoccus alkaliphilus DSM 16010]
MLINIFLIVVLAVCVVTDLRKRKIYNKVIFPSLLIAFGMNIAIEGISGLGESLLGFAAGFALLLIPYILGGMGAGDVKLLGLIGALKGSGFVLESFIYTAVIGAMLAILVIVMRGGFKKSLGVGMPYGVAIAGGAAMALLMDVEFL